MTTSDEARSTIEKKLKRRDSVVTVQTHPRQTYPRLCLDLSHDQPKHIPGVFGGSCDPPNDLLRQKSQSKKLIYHFLKIGIVIAFLSAYIGYVM